MKTFLKKISKKKPENSVYVVYLGNAKIFKNDQKLNITHPPVLVPLHVRLGA